MKPYFRYSFVISDDLKFKIWYADLVQSTDDIAHVVNGKHIKYFSEII